MSAQTAMKTPAGADLAIRPESDGQEHGQEVAPAPAVEPYPWQRVQEQGFDPRILASLALVSTVGAAVLVSAHALARLEFVQHVATLVAAGLH